MYGFQPAKAKEHAAQAEPRQPPKAPPTQLLGTGAAAQAAGFLRGRKAQIDAASNFKDGGMVKDYMNGGMVEGPGTGTSDSIKAKVPVGSYVMPADSTKAMGFKPKARQINVSDGEMIFNPKQVQAIGMKKLDKVKDATHTPAPMTSTSTNFRDGGFVSEEDRRRRSMVNQIPGASPAESSAAAQAMAERGPASGLGFKKRTQVSPSGVQGALQLPASELQLPQAPSPTPQTTDFQSRPTGQPAADGGSLAAPPGTPAARTMPKLPAGDPVEGAPSVYRFGRGQYGNNPEGMGFAPGFTGRPNAQNNAAAEALASRSAGRAPLVQAAGLTEGGGNITPETSGSGFGLLDQGVRDRRSAMMDTQQFKPGARQALASLLRTQEQAPVLDQRRDEAQMDQQGRTEDRASRAKESEADRALRSQELGDDMATNAVRREAAGFEVSSARQLQALRDEYLTARTPEERASAANKLRALQGATNPTKAPAPPPGYRWASDGQSMEAVPGGPADIKAGEMGVKRNRQREAAMNQADRVIGMTNKATEQVNSLSAGFIGSLAKGLPGSDARDLASNLETVKANLGFAELQAMRDASPTGGALGAIAVQELVALQSTVASLDQAQSPPQLRANLQKIGEHYQRWKSAVDQASNPDGQPARPESAGPQQQVERASISQASPAATTQEQWSQLPTGALYIAPDGSTRRKK